MAEIKSVSELLDMSLYIPNYQRPYKWTHRNIADLFSDINNAINDSEKYTDFKYRIGTIILHTSLENGKIKYDIVDGQQRIISLLLLQLYLDQTFTCALLSTNFTNKETQANISSNYRFINDWFALKSIEMKNKVKQAMLKILEVVVICVDKEAEAFQLFDSQNTRGKALDPHDLLKAYHLREMKNYPYEMQHAVTKWEAVSTKEIRELFELFLFPIQNFSMCTKSYSFKAQDIDIYKGVVEASPYSYAKRASKAMPYFQISQPFIAGNDFFEMVEHYLELLNDIKSEMNNNSKLADIRHILEDRANKSTGFNYAKNLFYCAFLCYYDRFRNFDKQVIKKLFVWAFMLRIDMTNLGFDSVNKYAIGESGYTNTIPMFSKITHARLHSEIANMQINIKKPADNMNEERKKLYCNLQKLSGKSERM